MPKHGGGKLAGVARGKTGGGFSSSPKSAAKSAPMMAGFARSGESAGTTMGDTARGGEDTVPSVLRDPGKETSQTGHDMKMQSKPAPNSEAPGGVAGNTGKKKPAIS